MWVELSHSGYLGRARVGMGVPGCVACGYWVELFVECLVGVAVSRLSHSGYYGCWIELFVECSVGVAVPRYRLFSSLAV